MEHSKVQKGKDVRLALDSELQQKAEEALRSQIKKTPDAKSRLCCSERCKNWRDFNYGQLDSF